MDGEEKMRSFMKTYKKWIMIFCGILAVGLIAFGIWAWVHRYTPYFPKEDAVIYLYGESHGEEKAYEVELREWQKLYNKGCRDLFVELPFYTAQYLNIWMKESDDTILEQLYEDIDGTKSHVPAYKEFFRQIKETCPETVFHGTDVGHQYDTTGSRYLDYAVEMYGKESEEVKLVLACIQQGEDFYATNRDDSDAAAVYREGQMVENFIREYELLKDKKKDKSDDVVIMGIYGSAHCDPRKLDYTNQVDCMAKQLKEKYGDIITYQYVLQMD